MNDIRRYISILENASQAELQKYRDEEAYWQNERKKYWPVSPELMAQYKDGSHTEEDYNGSLWWYQNGKWHRDGDLPAYIDEYGKLEWWQNGQFHRFSGPAIIRSNGTCRWYWRGERVPVKSQEEFIEYLKTHKGLQQFRVNKS